MTKEEKEVIKAFSKWVDDQIDFNKVVGGVVGAIAESVDGVLFKVAIQVGYDKLDEAWKAAAVEVMDAIVDGDLESLSGAGLDILVTEIKTPLGDDQEGIILRGLWDIIHKLIEVRR